MPNRSLLHGVPTNTQLTLTLLRIAEASKSPLPPPPTSQEATISDGEDDTDSFDASDYDIDSDSEEYPATENTAVDDETVNEQGNSVRKRKPGRRIAAALKRTVKAGVGGALGVDHLKAKVGSEHAKQRIGAVSAPPPTGEVVANSSKTSNVKENELPESVARVNLPGGEGPCVFSAR